MWKAAGLHSSTSSNVSCWDIFHVNCRVPGVTSGKVAAEVLCPGPAVLPQLVVLQGETSQFTEHSTAGHRSSDTSWSRFHCQHSCSILPTASRDPLQYLLLCCCHFALHSSRGSHISSQVVKFSNKVDKYFPFSKRPSTESTGPCLPCCIQWHNTCALQLYPHYSPYPN